MKEKIENQQSQYELEKQKKMRCRYHKMVESRVRKHIGWDENKFLKHDVSATSILEKEMEEYLFKNDARNQYCKQLKSGVSTDSIDKIFNRSPSIN